MTTLPSFVELMATLGIESSSTPSESTPTSRSSPPSPQSEMLNIPASSPTRSRSSPSLRDQASRSRTARYSPYSPTVSTNKRRGSVSSVSSFSSTSSGISQRTGSISPRPSPSPRIRRRTVNGKLTINVFGSSTDLPANTPISSYVRRKTPVTSPTSPTFPRDASNEVTPMYPMPFTLPKLPAFLPGSANSESFPITPDSELEEFSSRMSPKQNGKALSDDLEIKHLPSRLHTGIRISTSPRPITSGNSSRHPVQVHVA